MIYSKMFGKTIHGEQKGSDLISHRLLVKGGFIRESVAGRYYFLPLGWRVHENIRAIIKEEMDAAGAQEMMSPVLHPLELWEETNRTNTAGFELMKVKDRRGREFALGGTAEEMFVDVVRKFALSYKDLPINLYQFSSKFRDEMRARGGLLRLREFVMKDAYSFHTSEADFKSEYERMGTVYNRIFARMGLDTLRVAADNGYIGGEYCHEFQVEHPEGEGRFLLTENGYVAHEDVAEFVREDKNVDEPMEELRVVEAKRGTKMKDGVDFHNLPLWRQIKTVMYADENNNLIMAVLRGDLAVNEVKLLRVAGVSQLRAASVEEIRAVGSEPGFISPIKIEKVKIIGDTSLRGVRNAYGGANALNRDALNINLDRDYTLDVEADIAMAQAGFKALDGGELSEKRGIEVGNIFQLGYHYTKLMNNSTFVDDDGSDKPFYMGCYGIGLARTLATIVEKYHDDKGIMWPASVAPYAAHLISLPGGEDKAEEIYTLLQDAGIEVLWDDRDESAGTKFADADLIGIPVRLVVSKKTEGKVEWKRRDGEQVELVEADKLVQRLTA